MNKTHENGYSLHVILAMKFLILKKLPCTSFLGDVPKFKHGVIHLIFKYWFCDTPYLFKELNLRMSSTLTSYGLKLNFHYKKTK